MSKLFRKAKAGLLAKIEARYTGFTIEKSFADYVIIRYNGQWLYIIEDCGAGRILITHENASFSAKSEAYEQDGDVAPDRYRPCDACGQNSLLDGKCDNSRCPNFGKAAEDIQAAQTAEDRDFRIDKITAFCQMDYSADTSYISTLRERPPCIAATLALSLSAPRLSFHTGWMTLETAGSIG